MKTNPLALPVGAHCGVETLQPDPQAAAAFYGAVLGWRCDAPGPMPDGFPGDHRIARLDGRPVATIGAAPAALPAAVWTSYVRVAAITATVERAVAAGGTVAVPPSEHGDATIAVVVDPTGAAIGLRQDDRARVLADAPGAWTMSALHTPDIETSRRFYGATFGWTLAADPTSPVAVWRRADESAAAPPTPASHGTAGVLAPIAPGDPTPPHWSVCFAVADADAAVRTTTERGGRVLMPPVDAPTGLRSALLADPQGGPFAIAQPLDG